MGNGRRLRLLFPASLPLWALATGAALAAAPATPPAATGPKVEAATPADGAHKKDAAKGETKEAAKGVAKDAPKDAAKDPAKPEGDAAKVGQKDGAVAKSIARSVEKNDGPEETHGTAATEPNARKDEPPAGAAAGAAAPKKVEGGGAVAATDDPARPIGPPLKMSSLHDEMNRPPARKEEHATSHAERERLERLAAEINKAREALRQDTARLEAMLAARDAPAVAAASSSAAATDSGEPAKKIPSPLDNLAKAIRGMKPEQAAPILSRVDRKLAADVLLRMPGSDAGKVLGVCKPEVAAELAAEIASRAPRAELKR